MSSNEMNALQLQQFLETKEEETRNPMYEGGLFEDDLRYFGITFFRWETTDFENIYFFPVKEGYVSVRTVYDTTKLLLSTFEKVDDDMLKWLIDSKIHLQEQLQGIDDVLERYRLKTLFL